MKKILSTFLAFLATVLTATAVNPVGVFSTDGYYRVQNYGSERYAYVTDNTDNSDIVRNVFDLAALQLWKDLDRTISDPGSIIYIEQHGTNHYDLRAQGTGVYTMTGMYVNVKPSSSPAFKSLGLYEVSATGQFGGVTATKYLSDGEQSSVPDGVMSLNGTGAYRQWAVFPVSAADETNYFGITPTVTVADKHYYPFYAAFPFNFHSAGMKAYIITKVDAALGMAVLAEVTGTIPASTPVLIECSSTKPANNRLDLLASSSATVNGNLLRGVYFCNNKRPKSKDALTLFDANTMRVLGVTTEGQLGFVSKSANLKTFSNNVGSYLPANQAFLPVAEGTPEELKIVTEAEYQEALANIEYTITYMVDGKVYGTQSFKAGVAVTALDDPQKDGHTFNGWEGVPTEMPAQDVVVTGSFSINSYTITYVLEGDTYQTSTVIYGEKPATVPEPTREGYSFTGWEGVPETMPAHDVVVTGSFTINSYTLTFILDGKVFQTMTVVYGEEPTDVPEPTREGYTFSGWSGLPATMPAHDVQVVGTFTVNSYSLIYMVDDEIYQQFEVNYGEAITPLADPVREGYTFNGWDDVPATMPAHDVVVKGSFTLNDAIRDIVTDGKHVVYTLTGRRVEKNVIRKGVYIVDGKKVVLK